MIDEFENDFERAQSLQNTLILHATGGIAEDQEYKTLRKFFINKPETKNLIPSFVRTNRDFSPILAIH